jgi:hypothetical protein
MTKQANTYLSHFDVSLSTPKFDERMERKLNLSPEISFEEIEQTSDLDLMIACAPEQ